MFWRGRGAGILENLVILVDLDNLVVLGNLGLFFDELCELCELCNFASDG